MLSDLFTYFKMNERAEAQDVMLSFKILKCQDEDHLR